MGWTGLLNFCDSEEIYSGVSFQVRSSPRTFLSVLIIYSARQKSLDCRMIQCSASRFHSISTLVILASYVPSLIFSSTNLTRRCSHDRWITSHVHTPIFPQPKHSHRQRSCLGSNCCVSGKRTGLLAAIRRRMGIPTSPGPRLQEAQVR